MTQDRLVGDFNGTPNQFGRLFDLLPGKTDRLSIGKIERCGKINCEIVTYFFLRKRRPVAIRNLAARGGDIENVSARELLRFKRGDNRLFFTGGTSARGRSWRCLTKRLRGQEKQNEKSATAHYKIDIFVRESAASIPMQEALHFFGEFASNSFRLCDFLNACFA